VRGLCGIQTGDRKRKVKGDGRIGFGTPADPAIIPLGTRSSSSGDAMRVRHYAQGKFSTIECPEGTGVVRRSEQAADGETIPYDHLIVPLNGKEVRIPADPPGLLPMLAETGNFGVRLVGKPEPDVRLAGVSCPGCGEDDVAWLQPGDGSEVVHCDYCGREFDLPLPAQGRVSGHEQSGALTPSQLTATRQDLGRSLDAGPVGRRRPSNPRPGPSRTEGHHARDLPQEE
jgi:hypothetical protein